ncbi:hypothetical protein WJB48_005036, partial [Klebsiella pneumoniae]
ESVEMPLDYLQGHKDGLEWAAQLAEANHPETGDWLYDDPIELAKAIRKGPDMPPVQPVEDSESVIVVGDDGGDALSYRRLIQSFEPGTKLYRHAQPAPAVPENRVTAEHRRVIEMLLNVCGSAFELADDSCQQDVDGEDCHVVPDDAFQNLSDALDEIENTLPTEDIDRPDVFLAWSAMPRAALKSLLQAQPAPVVDADDNFYSWFGREWAENYQHNQYTTAAKQMLGVMAESAWKAGRRAAMLQAEPVCTCPSGNDSLRWPCPVHPGNYPAIGVDLASGPERTVEVRYVARPGYMMVPREPTKQMILAGQEELESCIDNGFDSDIDGNRYDYTDIVPDAPHRVFMAMLAAAQQEVR